MSFRIKNILPALLLFALLFCSCGKETLEESVNMVLREKDNTASEYNGKVVILNPASTYEAPKIIEKKSYESEGEEGFRSRKEAAGITEEAILDCMDRQAGMYMYQTMDEGLHRLYAEILLTAELHEKDILVSTVSAVDLQFAFTCVFQDHPELYWMDGYSYCSYFNGDQIAYLSFSGNYIYTLEECAALDSKIDLYVKSCEAGIVLSSDDYDKIRHVYEYIITHTEYVPGAKNNQNILSVFLEGESVCQGYAKAMQYILQDMDIPCTMVVGDVNEGEGHAWNLICLNDAYYYVDVTWGDSGYLMASGDEEGERSDVNYKYLNITTDELCRTHKLENVLPMPYCVATEDNYYVREGLYLEDYDEEKLKKIFKNAEGSELNHISFKCDDQVCFEECREKLVTQRKVFDLLPSGSDSADYSADEEMLVFSFWF